MMMGLRCRSRVDIYIRILSETWSKMPPLKLGCNQICGRLMWKTHIDGSIFHELLRGNRTMLLNRCIDISTSTD